MTGIDAKLQQKERMNLASTMQSPMIFVTYVISMLVRSCQFVSASSNGAASTEAESNSSAGQAAAASRGRTAGSKGLYNGVVDSTTGERLGHNLDKDELDLLINYIANRVWWRSSAQEYPMVRNAVADMFGYVAQDNREFSNVYIQEIFKVMAVSNFMVVKRYERPLLVLIKINDAYQKERITRILNNLYECFRKNTMLWKFCDSMIELTLKLAKRCTVFAAEMSKSRNMHNLIQTMTRENPSFPYN